MAEIERGLRDLEDKASPLFARIKQLEEDGLVVARHVKRLEGLTNHSADEIEAIVIELNHASKTTSKLTDSSRINGIPQRYNLLVTYSCITLPSPYIMCQTLAYTPYWLTPYCVSFQIPHEVSGGAAGGPPGEREGGAEDPPGGAARGQDQPQVSNCLECIYVCCMG